MDIYSVDPANLEAYMEQLRNRIFSKLQISQQTAKHLKAPGIALFRPVKYSAFSHILLFS